MLIWLAFFSRKYLWLSACSVGYAKMEQFQHIHYVVFLNISLITVVHFLDYFGLFFFCLLHTLSLSLLV